MYRTHRFTAAAAVLLVPAALAPAAVAGSTLPKVTVRVEGLTKTLLPATETQTKSGSITVGGAPKGACPATSAQGALNVATKGRWSGSFSKTYDDYFITKILGQTESGTKDYWEIFVNNVAAASGACEVKLRSGDQVLFAAVPSAGKAETPLGITITGTTAKVVAYTAKGKAEPLAGATVKSGTSTKTTNAKGVVTLPAYSKPTTVTASKAGYIRAEALAD